MNARQRAVAIIVVCGVALFFFNQLLTYLDTRLYAAADRLSVQAAQTYHQWAALLGAPVVLAVALGYLLGPVCLLVALLFRRSRAVAAPALVLGCVVLLLVISYEWERYRRGAIRAEALRAVAERSTGVVTALESYREDHGQYPTALEQLAPQYLNQPPSTGLAGFPRYEYGRIRTASDALFYLQIPLTRTDEHAGVLVYRPARKARPAVRYGDWVYQRHYLP